MAIWAAILYFQSTKPPNQFIPHQIVFNDLANIPLVTNHVSICSRNQDKQLRDLRLKEDEIMNSHDVVSPLRNVSINKVMAVIRKQLEATCMYVGEGLSRIFATPNQFSFEIKYV